MGTSSTLKGEIVLTHVQSIGKAMATGDVEEAEMKIDTRARTYNIRGPRAEISKAPTAEEYARAWMKAHFVEDCFALIIYLEYVWTLESGLTESL